MTQPPHAPRPGWGYGQTGQPGYGKPFDRPFSHPDQQLAAFGVDPAMDPAAQRKSKFKQQRRTGLLFALGYIAIIWAVHILNMAVFGGALNDFGVHPLDLTSIWHIFTSPLLHADLDHLIGNTGLGALFAFLVGYSGKRVFWEVTAFVVLIGGIGTWLFGGIGTNHIGASGLVYGWLAYLLVRGFFNRSAGQVLLGVILGFTYSGLMWGVLPVAEGVSWQAHLFGAIGGVAAGMIITSDDPPELAMKKAQKKQQKQRKNPNQPYGLG